MPGSSDSNVSRRKLMTAMGLGTGAVIAGCVGTGGDGGDGEGDGSGDGSSDGVASDDAEMADELTIWGFGTLPGGFEALAEAYNEDRGADVSFTVEELGYDENHNQYQTAISGGSGAPGVGTYESRWTPDLVGTGGLTDLSGEISSDTQDAVVDWTWDYVSGEDDGLYGMPMDIAPVAMFYNRNLLDEAGWTPEDIATYDDLVDLNDDLPDDVNVTTFGTGVLEWAWEMLLRQQGGQAYTEDGALMLNTEETRRAADTIKTLFDSGAAADIEEFTESWTTGLQEEQIAVVISGAWMAGALEGTVPDMSGDWGIAEPPAVTEGGGVATNHGGSNLVIADQLDEATKARAWDFIQFGLTNTDGVMTLAENSGIFPAHSGVYDNEFFTQEQEFFGGDSYDIFLELGADIPEMRMITDHREVYQRMGDFFANYVAGDYDSAEAMASDAEETIASEVDRDVA